jgi:hypothetical protein
MPSSLETYKGYQRITPRPNTTSAPAGAALYDDITKVADDVASITATAATLATTVGNNTASIGVNTSGIAANATAIAATNTTVAGHTTQINANTTGITANTASITNHVAATGTAVHGLGSASIHNHTEYDLAGAATTVQTNLNTAIALKSNIATPTFTGSISTPAINGNSSSGLAISGNSSSGISFASGPISFGDSTNFTFGASGGTQIGTAATQKMGFFGTTPITRPTGNLLTALGTSGLGIVSVPTIAESDVTNLTSDLTTLTNSIATTNTSIATKVGTVSLVTPSVLYSNPVNFVTTTGVATGTLVLNTQVANKIFAGTASGTAVAPTFRSLVANDLPATLNTTTFSSMTTTTINGNGNLTLNGNGSGGIILCGDVCPLKFNGAAVSMKDGLGANGGVFSLDGGTITNGSSITSTTFVGSLTGNVTGNVSGTASNITGNLPQSQVVGLSTSLAAKSPIASPTFTGTITGNLTGNVTGNVSGSAGTVTSNLPQSQITGLTTALGLLAPLATATNTWQVDSGGQNRAYYAAGSQTIFEAVNGFQFRNGSDVTIMNLDTNGIVKMGSSLATIKLALYDNNTGSGYYGFGVATGYVVATANDIQCAYFSSNAGGSLGVHNASPQAYLDVAGSNAPSAIGVEDMFYLTKPTAGGVSYLEMAGFALGRWATTGAFEPKSRLDIKLKDAASATAIPEVTVMTLQSNGAVGVGQTTPTATLDVGASTTTKSSLRIRSGTAPTTPNDGDVWFDGTNLKIRVSGVTKTFTIT